MSAANHSNPGLQAVEYAENLLAVPQIKAYLSSMKQLISVSSEDYQNFYYACIQSIAECLQNLPKPSIANESKPLSLLQWSLEHTLAVLKFRRAYMLPTGADTETCYAQQDIWTYAVFTACLLQACQQAIDCFDVTLLDKNQQNEIHWNRLSDLKMPVGSFYAFTPKNIFIKSKTNTNLDLGVVEKLLPHEGLAWLQHYPTIYETWKEALLDKTQTTNCITLLLTQAAAALSVTS